MPTLQQELLLLLGPVTWRLSAPGPTVVGAEEMTNGGLPFTFTADDPDSYSIIGEAGAAEVTEVAVGETHADAPTIGGGYLNIYRPDSGATGVLQLTGTNGAWHRAVITVNVRTVGAFNSKLGVTNQFLSTAGVPSTVTLTATQLADATHIQVYSATGSGHDITYTSISLKIITNLLSGVNTLRSRHTVRADVTIPGNRQGGVWSDGDDPDDPQNYLLAYYDKNNGTVRTVKYLAGVFDSELSSDAATYSAGAELKIVPDGNDRGIWYNGALITTETMADAAIINGTHAGLFSPDSTSVSFTGAVAFA